MSNDGVYLNEPVVVKENYVILMSYFPNNGEFHYHMDMPKATAENFKEINKDMDIIIERLTDTCGTDTVYTIVESGNKQQEAICRLAKFKQEGVYSYEGKEYVKYLRRKEGE